MSTEVLVRFRNNKPYFLKKILSTVLVSGALIYFAVSAHWLTVVLLSLFTFIPLLRKISKQQSEGKGFFGKLKNFYKGMYRDYVIDILPVSYEIDVEKIKVHLHKAERMKGHIVNETFTISKADIAGILYDDMANDILIMFQNASVIAVSDKTKDTVREAYQKNSTICFHLDDTDIVEQLIFNGYNVEYLSAIEDEEEETEDPELVAERENNSEIVADTENGTENS